MKKYEIYETITEILSFKVGPCDSVDASGLIYVSAFLAAMNILPDMLASPGSKADPEDYDKCYLLKVRFAALKM